MTAAMAFDAHHGAGHLPLHTLGAFTEVGRGRRTITPDDPLAALLPPGWLDGPDGPDDPASVHLAALAAVLARPQLRIGVERRVAGGAARSTIAWTPQATLATGAPDAEGQVAVAITNPHALADVLLGVTRLAGRPAAPTARCDPQQLADAVGHGRGAPIGGTSADQLVLVRVTVTVPTSDTSADAAMGADATARPTGGADPSDPHAEPAVAYDLLDGDEGLWRIDTCDHGPGELVLEPWSGADEHARWTAIHDRLTTGEPADRNP